uniref:Uncharacterized protein n=1 Tax=viral metagenome TaxID=1070528 RepID=A0A6H1ZKB8_9ZZZZ
MMKTFYFLLKENNYNWEEAMNVFYNLTDLQVGWINYMAESESLVSPSLQTPGFQTVKSFNLNQR